MTAYLDHTKEIAESTPATRNRVIDFWRAFAILIVFVHNSNIEGGDDKASLEEGQTVEFEIGPGRKGDEARNVRVV